MKISDGFDARRLRPSPRNTWGLRVRRLLGVVLTLIGVLLTGLAGLALLGLEATLGAPALDGSSALIVLTAGLALFAAGWLLWRRCSLRLRQPDGLSLAPHLFRRRG